jgi:hypothetical protein
MELTARQYALRGSAITEVTGRHLQRGLCFARYPDEKLNPSARSFPRARLGTVDAECAERKHTEHGT